MCVSYRPLTLNAGSSIQERKIRAGVRSGLLIPPSLQYEHLATQIPRNRLSRAAFKIHTREVPMLRRSGSNPARWKRGFEETAAN